MFIKEIVNEQVRLLLRNQLTKVKRPRDSIKVMKDERVPPGAGEEFIGVFGGEYEGLNEPHDVTKRYLAGFTVGITRRMVGTPNEQAGENVLTYDQIERVKPSMYARADEIGEVLNQTDGWTLINAINAAVALAQPNVCGMFITTFGMTTVGPTPEEVREEHFDIQPENTGLARDVRYLGLLLRLEFSGAEYIRASRPAAS